LLVDDPNVIFYAGTQLMTPTNLALGTLCVIDNKPKKLNDFQKRALEVLGKQISNQFELRRNINRMADSLAGKTSLAMAIK